MNCPNCNQKTTKVTETRTTPDTTWRARRCTECGWRVTTKEIFAEDEEQSIPERVRKPWLYKETADDGAGT